MTSEFDNHFYEAMRENGGDRTDMRAGNAGLMHSIPHFMIRNRHPRLRRSFASHRTKTGHSPRQRKNGPDHKLSVLEAAMADKADTRIPRERQDDRYSRAIPIGQVVHNILTDLGKKVGK